MTSVPQLIPFQRGAIDDIQDIDDAKRWLKDFVLQLDTWWISVFDQIENGGMSTPNWDIREATAADVTAGDAKVKGNLIVIHKTNGARDEFEA